MRGKLRRLKKRLTKFLPRKYILYEGDINSKQIALTFDDGPNPDYTEKFLELLSDYKIKATFFLLGKNLEKYPQIARKIVSDGHVIGNHTHIHKRIDEISIGELKNELNNPQNMIRTMYNRGFNYFRPPYGKFSLVCLSYCIFKRFTTVLWTLDSRDFEHRGKQHILNNVIGDGIKGGDIILFHDDNEFTLEALPEIIEHLRKKGFEFITVEEMLN